MGVRPGLALRPAAARRKYVARLSLGNPQIPWRVSALDGALVFGPECFHERCQSRRQRDLSRRPGVHSPEELASYLDQACAGDAALRTRVEELLAPARCRKFPRRSLVVAHGRNVTVAHNLKLDPFIYTLLLSATSQAI